MLTNTIQSILAHFSLAMLSLAILLSIFHKIIHKKTSFYEILYCWIAFLALGITGIYTFIMHGFFPTFTAEIIGWPNSPFQLQVAIADLGFAFIALLSLRKNHGVRITAMVGNTVWLWGNAFLQARRMTLAQNFDLTNAGSWFYTDMIIPIVIIICLAKIKPHK